MKKLILLLGLQCCLVWAGPNSGPYPTAINYTTVTNIATAVMTAAPITLTPTVTTNLVDYGTNTVYVTGSDDMNCIGAGAWAGAYVYQNGNYTNATTGNYFHYDTPYWYFYDVNCWGEDVQQSNETNVLWYATFGQINSTFTDMGTVTVGTNSYATNGVVAWNFTSGRLQTVSATNLNNLLVILGSAQSGYASTLRVDANSSVNVIITNSLAWLNGSGVTNTVTTNTYISAQAWSTNHADTAVAIKSKQ